MELYRVYLDEGKYQLKLGTGSNISTIEKLIAEVIPLPAVDLASYKVQIRASVPQLSTFLAIPAILLGLAAVLGAIVLLVFVG